MIRRSAAFHRTSRTAAMAAVLTLTAVALTDRTALAQAPPASAPPASAQAAQPRPDTPIARNVATMAPGSWRALATRNKLVDVFPKRDGHPA